MSIEFIRTEIERLQVQISRQQTEIVSLRQEKRPTGLAEELLARMKANIQTLSVKCELMAKVG